MPAICSLLLVSFEEMVPLLLGPFDRLFIDLPLRFARFQTMLNRAEPLFVVADGETVTSKQGVFEPVRAAIDMTKMLLA